MDWLDLLAVQGTLRSLLQHHSSKASILWRSAFFMVQLSHPYMSTGKTIALTRWTFVGKVVSRLCNMLSRLVVAFLPRSARPLTAWLPSASSLQLLPVSFRLHYPLLSGDPFAAGSPFPSCDSGLQGTVLSRLLLLPRAFSWVYDRLGTEPLAAKNGISNL